MNQRELGSRVGKPTPLEVASRDAEENRFRRSSVLSTRTRRSRTAIRSRRTSSPTLSGCDKTISPRPRWIHDLTVEGGIRNSGKQLGSRLRAICSLIRWSYTRRLCLAIATARVLWLKTSSKAETVRKAVQLRECRRCVKIFQNGRRDGWATKSLHRVARRQPRLFAQWAICRPIRAAGW